MLLAGLTWAAFAYRLHADGRAPSRVLLPIEPESYYLAQALFIVPTLLALWCLLVAVAHWLSGAARGGSFTRLAGPLGLAYGLPLIACFLLPEWLVYEQYGAEALRRAFRYTAPLTALTTWLAAAWVLRQERALSRARALGVALLALVVQATVGAPFLR